MDEFRIVLMDANGTLLAIGLGWLAVLGLLAWGGAEEPRPMARSPARAPFFAMLERHGLTLVQAEEAAGLRAVGEAAGRCASCGSRVACRRALRWSAVGFEAPPCPNAAFLARVRG
jgi:hypothetical protein